MSVTYNNSVSAAVLSPLEQQNRQENLTDSVLNASRQFNDNTYLDRYKGPSLSSFNDEIENNYYPGLERSRSLLKQRDNDDFFLDHGFRDDAPYRQETRKPYEVTGFRSLDRTIGSVVNDLKGDESFRKIYFSVKSLQIDMQLAGSSLWFTTDLPNKEQIDHHRTKSILSEQAQPVQLTSQSMPIDVEPPSLKKFLLEYWYWVGLFALFVGLLEYFIWRIITRNAA